jgi:hypothetical protein
VSWFGHICVTWQITWEPTTAPKWRACLAIGALV